MAKKPNKPKPRAKKTKRATARRAPGPHPYAHEDHIDACDVDFQAGRLTLDWELPAAVGGVQVARRKARGAPPRWK